MLVGQTAGTLLETLRSGLSNSSYNAPDKASLRKAAHSLAELCKQDEYIDEVVFEGAIEVVVPLLNAGAGGVRDQQLDEGLGATGPSMQEELDKELCFILGLLAVKPEYQTRIAQSGALTGLVRLLKEHKLTSITKPQPGSGGVARRAADAITNLAHENVEIKNMVREQDGIPPLVGLLEAMDVKVQRAACGALRTLAFKNEQNKNVIVEQGALPTLIQLLRSEDSGVHYEAVGVIGNLVHSSQHVKLRVLEEGALQPVINLLNSDCPDSQRESALLLGQFATADPDTKAKIVQRGAVPALVRMLSMPDVSLREMAAFALGRLAQNVDNQAGIVQLGGLPPLLELLESKHYNLQHNAAFALYGLAENEDNIPDLIREGALQRLEDCKEKLQASKDCVQKTINRLEQKLRPDNTAAPNLAAAKRALQSMVFLLRSNTKTVQQRAAMSLARLAPDEQLKAIFIDKRGIDVLLDMLMDPNVSHRSHREAAAALLQLTKKLDAHLPVVDQLPQQPGRAERSVYLGSEYVNNPTLADITFNVEGRKFYAHRIALLASSEAFRAMFSGGYREKDADSVDIPNISWHVFEAMMRFVYTGQLDVTPDIAFELLQASDQYLLEGLKRLCENSIAQSLTVESVMSTFEYSEQFSAPQLGRRCLLFILEMYDDVSKVYDNTKDRAFYFDCLRRMVPCLKDSLYCGAGPIWDNSALGQAAGASSGGGAMQTGTQVQVGRGLQAEGGG
ncbi:hypothetical protein VOLCADRAFT_61760 [Volvox carteri f. nagariensis]|uniref:BTB domain-containing protein n=1 Tax=Volvox carteri f. nagariensis TaxID=3068 RepID=D8TZZ7_VOLCA|nr:uncharacterized protein VOLCADRAFT_61760 [Volvox carteri f. nagariensis]EFJ47093.1 hypothetical protein VOLCADRAFT_61760 [Volvox carteri f. nagariensis]|eukprot:XP_002951988.1 hypothetical protein VOLCADRAFT_61760 [Volvox carteri f. nagariensis]